MPRSNVLVATVTAVAVAAVVGVAVAAAMALAGYGDESGERPLAMPRGPVMAALDLTADGKDRWRETLGDECDLENLLVIALDSGPDGYDVISMPGPCEVERFTVAREHGRLRPDYALTLGGG